MSKFYFGEFYHQLDDKMRMRIPASFRALLGEKPFIFAGEKGQLMVMPEKEALELLERSFGDITLDSTKTDDARDEVARRMLAKTMQAEEDKQGRFVLLPSLKKHANIDKSIVVIGRYKWIEIWAEETYKERYGI